MKGLDAILADMIWPLPGIRRVRREYWQRGTTISYTPTLGDLWPDGQLTIEREGQQPSPHEVAIIIKRIRRDARKRGMIVTISAPVRIVSDNSNRLGIRVEMVFARDPALTAF